MPKVKKNDLIKSISENANVSKQSAALMLDIVTNTLLSHVINGNDINIPGLLTIKHVDRKERIARNPRTGESVLVPAKKTVKALLSKDIKSRL